jgi:hypothetical protein
VINSFVNPDGGAKGPEGIAARGVAPRAKIRLVKRQTSG